MCIHPTAITLQTRPIHSRDWYHFHDHYHYHLYQIILQSSYPLLRGSHRSVILKALTCPPMHMHSARTGQYPQASQISILCSRTGDPENLNLRPHQLRIGMDIFDSAYSNVKFVWPSLTSIQSLVSFITTENI